MPVSKFAETGIFISVFSIQIPQHCVAEALSQGYGSLLRKNVVCGAEICRFQSKRNLCAVFVQIISELFSLNRIPPVTELMIVFTHIRKRIGRYLGFKNIAEFLIFAVMLSIITDYKTLIIFSSPVPRRMKIAAEYNVSFFNQFHYRLSFGIYRMFYIISVVVVGNTTLALISVDHPIIINKRNYYIPEPLIAKSQQFSKNTL